MKPHHRKFYSLFFIFLLCAAPTGARETSEAKLEGVRTIYVVPMRERLGHFLTNEIVRWGYFEVTLNPQQADAVLSDTTDLNLEDLLSDSPKIRRTSARTRGTAFLIDRKTAKVLWSAAKKSSDSFLFGGDKSARELAQEIVGQLKKDVKKKK